ncbi:uncharacterized protein A4U43_C08F24410 [Asparagus officinalis]|uniref:thioredoxin O2, mitochondrial-like n=1 Tax=Asparagus officinalis TaxID=4686 RepID=UPI00098E58CF|nr:thioredoxin O2, mitochondrial-like [Asparagus officinalis]ONK60947.1 uncharacterized protein A4U43_C08F24410 [Asparagus officinalis]
MAPKIRALLRSSLLRPLLLNQTQTLKPHTPSLQNANPFSSRTLTLSPPKPSLFSIPFLFSSRAFCSSPSSSDIVLIGSEQGLNAALSKVQDEKLPAIFYFTAAWCGPCKMLSPVIQERSKKFPHVTTYKIDIDQEGLGSILSKLQIYSVPTLHFYQDGKKASEMIGADVARLDRTMENLYKKE